MIKDYRRSAILVIVGLLLSPSARAATPAASPFEEEDIPPMVKAEGSVKSEPVAVPSAGRFSAYRILPHAQPQVAEADSYLATECPPVESCDLLRDPGPIGYVDYLGWKARRSGLDFATFGFGQTTLGTESLAFDRESGIRVGVGYAFASGVDLTWNFTYFRSDDQQTAVGGDAFLLPPPATVLHASRSVFSTAPMLEVEASAKLSIDIHDLEASWGPCPNDPVGFRWFGGVRWAKIDQEFDTLYAYRLNPADPLSELQTGAIHLPSEMHAAGIRLGAELNWKTARGFRFFGRGAHSLLVADFTLRDRELDTSAVPLYQNPLLDLTERSSRIVPVLEAAVGIAWSYGPLELTAGYEMSNWFNMAEFAGDPTTGIREDSQSLFIDGCFLRLAYVR